MSAIGQADSKCFDASEVVRMLYNRAHHVFEAGTVCKPRSATAYADPATAQRSIIREVDHGVADPAARAAAPPLARPGAPARWHSPRPIPACRQGS
jgi:hypothetical protein